MQIKQPTFRVRLDVPYSFAVEPGYARAQHSYNFRSNEGDVGYTPVEGIYHCPVTGVIMLEPSTMSNNLSLENWEQLTSWLYDPDFWREVFDGADPALGYTTATWLSTVIKTDGTGTPIGFNTNSEALETLAALSPFVGASLYDGDTLYGALRSNFLLARDEGFSVHYKVAAKEKFRGRHFLGIVFGNHAFRFDYDGYAHRFVYEDGLDNPPTFVEKFQIAAPDDIIGKEGYITFIPIPGFGLTVHNSNARSRFRSVVRSGGSSAFSGHLCKMVYDAGDGYWHVHNGGQVRILMNPHAGFSGMKVGFHRIRYSMEPVTFDDDHFTLNYRPTVLPFVVRPVEVPQNPALVDITAQLINSDGAAWSIGDSSGRFRFVLESNDDTMTPVLYGSVFVFKPVYNNRDTTVVMPYRLHQLEFSHDTKRRFSGSCTLMMRTDEERWIAERGDTTITVDIWDPVEEEWFILGGGIAKLSDCEAFVDTAGMYYLASWQFAGLEMRLKETHQHVSTAFDGDTMSSMINTSLTISGFEFLLPGDFPALLDTLRMPTFPQGQEWRFGPKAGDDSQDVIDFALSLLSSQSKDYVLFYDWEFNKWVCGVRDIDVLAAQDPWTLTPFESEADLSERRVLVRKGDNGRYFSLKVRNPEGNVVRPFGMTEVNDEKSLLQGNILTNFKSLNDKTSRDYLGRVKVLTPVFAPLSVLDGFASINSMGRSVYDSACRWTGDIVLQTQDFIQDMGPDQLVILRGLNDVGVPVNLFSDLYDVARYPEYGLFVKSRTFSCDYTQSGVGTTTYLISSRWKHDLEGGN